MTVHFWSVWFWKTHQSLSTYPCTQLSDTTGCLLSPAQEFLKIERDQITIPDRTLQKLSETRIFRWYHQATLIKEVKENK